MEILVSGSSVKTITLESSLRISGNIQSRSTAAFTLRDPAGTVDLAVGVGVQIYDGAGVSIFGGTIEEVQRHVLVDGTGIETQIQCVSHEQRLDKRVVQSRVYTATTAGAVVTDLVNTFADGENIFTVDAADIQAGASVDKIIYDYDKRLSEALDELATLSNYIWYVDPDGYLYFVPRTTYPSPWTLTNAKVLDGSLTVRRSRSGVINREWYRVNWSAFPSTVETFTGNDVATSFSLAEPVNRIDAMKVDDVEVSYGVLSVDTDREWYFSPGTATITQAVGAVALTAAQSLVVSYRGLSDDILMADDLAAIAARATGIDTGIYEGITDDQSAVNAAAALAKAQSLVNQYKNTALTVEFSTIFSGLKPGQLLTCAVTTPTVSGTWLVESVDYELDLYAGEHEYRYRVRIIDGSRIGGWLQFWENLAGAITNGGGISLGASTGEPGAEDGSGVEIPSGQVTLGTPQLRYSLPDAQGKVYAEITVPVAPPAPLGDMDRVVVQMQAPDDAADKAEIGIEAGWTIPWHTAFTADAATDTLTAAAHPYANGNYVRVLNTGGGLPGGLGASTYYYVVSKTTNTLQLSLTPGGAAVPISSAGTGTNNLSNAEFASVLPLNEPEVSFVKMWRDAEGVVRVRHPAPAKNETWRLYVSAASETYSPPIIRADVSGASPNVAIEVSPPSARGLGEEWGPLGSGFTAKTDSTYTAGVKYEYQDGGDILYGLGVEWTAPDLSQNPEIGGYDVAIRYSDGRIESSVTAISANDTPEWISDSWPLQNQGATFRLYLVTYDVNGRRNTIIDGTTPHVDITVTRPALVAGEEWAPLATGFAAKNNTLYTDGVHYFIGDSGASMYSLSAIWDSPDIAATPQLGGYDVVIEYDDGRRSAAATFSGNDTPEWISGDWTILNDGTTLIVYLVSFDTNSRRNTITAATPVITVSVSFQEGSAGQEYCANISELNVGTFSYDPNGQGQQVATVPVTVDLPGDPRFGDWTVYCDGPGFNRAQMSGPIFDDNVLLEFTDYPEAAQDWTFYAITRDRTGRANTNSAPSYVTGTFETVSVGPPTLGSFGVEYTPLVGNPSTGAMFDYQTRVTQEGIEEFSILCRWSNPTDVTFGGAKLVLKKTSPSAEFFPGEYAGPTEIQLRTKWRTIVDGEQFVIYIISMDVNNRENNLSESLTPKSGTYTSSAAATGKLRASRLDPAYIGTGLALTSFVLQVPVGGITEALINNFAVTEDKLVNAPIIGAARIKNAAIENAKFDRVSVNKIAIVDADVANLACNKLLAGTIAAAISMTSVLISVTGGPTTVTLNAGAVSPLLITNTSTLTQTHISGTTVDIFASAGSNAFSASMSTTSGMRVQGQSIASVASINANSVTAALSLNRGSGFGRSVEIFTVDQTTSGGSITLTPPQWLTVRINGSFYVIPCY